MIERAALVVALSTAGVAHADPPAAPRPAKPATTAEAATAATSAEPDPAVAEAADANLESTGPRRGVTFAGAIGAGLTVGFGVRDSIGRGGSASFRLGHGATRRTVIVFEIGITAVLHERGTNGPIETNTNTNLLAGAQYYVNQSLWVRFGGGVGVYQGRQVALSAGVGDVTLVGPAALGGVGLDILRIKSVVLDFEIATSALINSQGVLVASGANFGLSFD